MVGQEIIHLYCKAFSLSQLSYLRYNNRYQLLFIKIILSLSKIILNIGGTRQESLLNPLDFDVHVDRSWRIHPNLPFSGIRFLACMTFNLNQINSSNIDIHHIITKLILEFFFELSQFHLSGFAPSNGPHKTKHRQEMSHP